MISTSPNEDMSKISKTMVFSVTLHQRMPVIWRLWNCSSCHRIQVFGEWHIMTLMSIFRVEYYYPISTT